MAEFMNDYISKVIVVIFGYKWFECSFLVEGYKACVLHGCEFSILSHEDLIIFFERKRLDEVILEKCHGFFGHIEDEITVLA